jgi:hypothetical protein
MEAPLTRPTRAKLEKILALANDDRGDVQMRRSAKRILARYAKHFPDLLRVKDDHRKDR